MSDESGFRRTFRVSEHSPDVPRDVEDELSFYVEMRERELREAGHSAEDAKRLALEAFGDRARIAAEVRAVSGARVRRNRARDLIASVLSDARFGWRGLVRSPAFAIAAVTTLALGIGANAMVFSLIEAILLRAPSVRSPETLAAVYTTCRRGDPRCSSSYPDYEDYRDRTRAFADLAAYSTQPVTVGGDAGGAEVVSVGFTTGNFFTLLGVNAVRGRALELADDAPGGEHRVVVLSHGFWQARFGRDAGVVGTAVRLNGVPHTVVGVAPRSFAGLRLGGAPALWVPLQDLPLVYPGSFDPAAFDSRASRWIGGLVARLSEGATVERARAELLSVSAQLAREDSAARGSRSVTVDPLPRYVLPAGGERMIVQFMAVLQAVVALTLVLACANLANLLLARGSARRRELGVRAAIGAGRGRMMRQLLTEGGLLAVAGGIAGLALTSVGLGLISSYRLPFGFDIAALDARINGRVILFTGMIAALTVAAFGTLPALASTRGDLASVLRESRTGGGPRGARLHGVLVGVQVALCVVLLAGAGVFLRTLRNYLDIDLGLRTEGVALLTVDPSMNQYAPARITSLVRDLTERAAALPGVASASAGLRVPVRAGGMGTFVQVEGYTPAPDEEMRVEFNYVAPLYFRTLELPLVRGREFDERDGPGAPRVAVVNEEMAKAWWLGRDAIGGLFTFRGEQHVVVGIARNTAWSGLQVGGSPFVFVPMHQSPAMLSGPPITFIVRTEAGREDVVLPELRAALRSVDPGLAVNMLTTLDREVTTRLAPQRAAAYLLGGFSGLALILASIGIYGVVAYSVAERRRDFGIRMALGARASQVIAQVAGGIGAAVVLGLAIGLVAVVALGRAVEGLVYDVTLGDPLTLGAALAILALAAAAATWIPARRAARTDPMVVMRAE